MRRAAVQTVIGMALLLSCQDVRTEQTTVLKDVRSSAQDASCRMTFTFAGDIRFSTEQGKGILRLVFPSTHPATARTIARRNFPSGPVESIVFTRAVGGSLLATLALVEGSTYRCVCPSNGHELYVDVRREGRSRPVSARTGAQKPIGSNAFAGTQQVVAVGASAQGTPDVGETARDGSSTGAQGQSVPAARLRRQRDAAAGGKLEGVPAIGATTASVAAASASDTPGSAGMGSLIDIPDLARRQMEPENQETAPARLQASHDMPASGLSPGIALLMSLCVSFGSTVAGCGLWVLLRRHNDRRKRKHHALPELNLPAPGQPDADSFTGRFDRKEADAIRFNERIASTVLDDVEEGENERETSLQLARTFRRGSEEIALAQRLHEHAVPALTPERMDTVLSRATTTTQRLHAARKMGVGRGEFDLAVKLKSMTQVQEKKEEDQ